MVDNLSMAYVRYLDSVLKRRMVRRADLSDVNNVCILTLQAVGGANVGQSEVNLVRERNQTAANLDPFFNSQQTLSTYINCSHDPLYQNRSCNNLVFRTTPRQLTRI
jgi:hypothetical protein